MRAAEYWEQAMDAHVYLARMTQRREEYQRGIAEAVIPDAARAAFAGRPLRVLVLTEDFCIDSAQFVPPLLRLAQELDTLEVRFLLRNEHRDLAAQYLRWDGYQPIPVLIFLDADGEEIGALIERPRRMYDEMAAETRRFARENPHLEGVNRTYQQMPPETRAAVSANMEAFRTANAARYIGWLWEDLVALLARRPAGTPATG